MELSDYLPYIAALLVVIPVLVLFRQFAFRMIELKEKELKLLSVKSGGENKLQAYERMTLFLERIKPANLVAKFDRDLKPHEFIFLVEKSVSEEFDYNSSMQLYISKVSWQNITSAKNQIIQLAHKTYEGLNNETSLEDFKTVFLMNYLNGEDFIAETIDDLRKEMRQAVLNNC